MLDEDGKKDVKPTDIQVYGWLVVYKKDGEWKADKDDEYSNLPAHFPFAPQAFDRAEFLKSKGIECRVCALLVQPTDTVEEFERNKIDG